MSDKQHYIKLEYEFGVDNGDGTFEMKNESKLLYVSLPIESAVELETRAFVPAMKLILDAVTEMGIEIASLPGQVKR